MQEPSSVGLLVSYVLKNSTICDFHVPNDAICFSLFSQQRKCITFVFVFSRDDY